MGEKNFLYLFNKYGGKVNAMEKVINVWDNLKEIFAVAAVVGAILFSNNALETRIETRLNNVEQAILQLSLTVGTAKQDLGTIQGTVNTLVELSKPNTP